MTDITVRRMRFTFTGGLDDVLPGLDPVAESYLLGFSLTMPSLEPYLIRTFRSVLPRVTDEALAADVRAFVGQEAQHFQNHRRANEHVLSMLPSEVAAQLTAIEERLEADYQRFTGERSDRFNVAYAEGFEAMTCAMAMTMMERAAAGVNQTGRPGRFDPWQQLWAWHAAEELEHRTVAFDLYEHLVGDWSYRVSAGLVAQHHFQRYIDAFQAVILAAMGEPVRRHRPPWRHGDGAERYRATFRRSYHPGRLRPHPLAGQLLATFTPTE